MNYRAQLEKKIQNKQQEIEELRKQLNDAEIFLQGMQEALKVLPKDDLGATGEDQSLRPGSAVAKAREYLLSIKKQAYITEILKGIGKNPESKTDRISVSGSLSSYARKNQIFIKVGPNTYSLREFAKVPLVVQEPPDEFGTHQEEEETA